MSHKLLMNNSISGSNMQVQKGTVIATNTNNSITVNDLNFTPDIVLVRIKDISTYNTVHSLFWIYTKYASCSIRTDSGGIKNNIANKCMYTDLGYTKGDTAITVKNNSFTFSSLSNYGPIQAGDEFEYVAIAYDENKYTGEVVISDTSEQTFDIDNTPDIVIARYIGDTNGNIDVIIKRTFLWIYTKFATFTFRTDSEGFVQGGFQASTFYNDCGYIKNTSFITITDKIVSLKKVNDLYPLNIGDVISYSVIKYE